MDVIKAQNTSGVYTTLTETRNGGGFVVLPSAVPVPSNTDQTAVRRVTEVNNFEISLYNQQSDDEVITLEFLINPSDVTIGQTFVAQDSYTREGWLSTLWGKGQPTILANGSTGAFYLNGVGLTAVSRGQTMSFRNFISIIAIFKNGGYYYLKGAQNKDLFGVDRGRVISVMDLIKINYDGTEYIGSFNNFTIEESAENPFRFTFNFEFVISGLRGEMVEGHLKLCKNGVCNNIDGIQIESSGGFVYTDIIKIDPNSQDIRPPTNFSTTGGSGISSPGKTNAPVVPTAGRIIIPAVARRDVSAFTSAITNNPDVEIRGDLNTENARCAKKSVVRSFSDNIDLDSIVSKAVATPGLNVDAASMTTYLQTIMSLEQSSTSFNSYMSTGQSFPTSGAGALGPTQIMPNTYISMLQNNPKFISYMKSQGYTPAQCAGAVGTHAEGDDSSYGGQTYPIYRGGILSTDPKFNVAACAYLVATYYSKPVSGTNPMANNVDIAGNTVVVAVAHNGGPKTFSNGNNDYSLAGEAATYGATAYALVTTTCSGSNLSP
jgi:hypothetical protein